jgi:hypothetical protein
MFKTRIGPFLAAIVLTLAVPAQAITARDGVVRCGGNNHLRQGGTEVRFNSFSLHNFDSATPITITRMRFFDGSGAVLLDSLTSGGLPPSQSGLLGGANNVLAPNQSVAFHSVDFLQFLPQNSRPIQMELTWSAAKSAQVLYVTTSPMVRQWDSSTNQQGSTRAKGGGSECTAIFLK